jgi:hypothetical protein
MKHILKYIILYTILFASLQFSFILSQNKIEIKLKTPPSNKLGVAELWNLTLSNNTGKQLKIYLVGTVTEEKNGLIIEGKSNLFSLPASGKSYGYNDFKEGSVKYNNKNYQEVLLRSGNVPAGTYTICVTAYDESVNVVGMEKCINQKVEILSSSEITLLTPSDGDKIIHEQPILFSWSPNASVKEYSIKIVELMSNQNIDEAISNNIPFYEKKKIINSSFQYPLSEKKFEKGKKYAWLINSGVMSSEIWSFEITAIKSGYCDYMTLTMNKVSGIQGCYDLIANVNQTFNWTGVKISHSSAIFSSFTNILNGWEPKYEPGQTTAPFSIIGFKKGLSGSALQVGSTTISRIYINVNTPVTVSLYWSTNSGSDYNCSTDVTLTDSLQDSCECTGNWNSKYQVSYINPQNSQSQYSGSCDNFSNIPFEVKKSTQVNFHAFTGYNCLPNNENCLKYWWKIIQTGTTNVLKQGTSPSPTVPFIADLPQSPPNYTFIINAICGTDTCDSCGFNFTVKDSTNDSCECTGDWNSKYNVDYTTPQSNTTHYSGSCDNFSNTPFQVKAGTSMTFNAFTGYNCSPNNQNCLQYKWKVIQTGTSVVVSQGVSSTPSVQFTANFPPSPPNYTFIIYAFCGQDQCDSCGFNFSVACTCGSWPGVKGPIFVNTLGGKSLAYSCGSTHTIKNKSTSVNTIEIRSSYICPDGCPLSFTWEIFDSKGKKVKTGNGTLVDYKNILLYLKPQKEYLIIFYPNCGNVQCAPCRITIVNKRFQE